MNKKLNSNSSAGTTADSDKTPKIPTSSHACSNTFVVRSPNVLPTESILDKIVRPNLNPYSGSNHWVQVERLKKGAKARFLRFCLDSVALMPLVNRSLLFRALSNYYNRCIEPSQTQADKKFQSIVHFEKEAVVSEQEKYGTVL